MESLIELAVVVCLRADPNACEDRHFTFPNGHSMVGCMVEAQPFLADWEAKHPRWTVRHWKCGRPGSRPRDA